MITVWVINRTGNRHLQTHDKQQLKEGSRVMPSLETYQNSVIGAILLEELQEVIKRDRAVLGKAFTVDSALLGLLFQVVIKDWQWMGGGPTNLLFLFMNLLCS